MKRKPKQGFNDALAKAVIDYHEWHRDKNIELKDFVCDDTGDSVILTRVVDEHGNKKSCLLSFGYRIKMTTGEAVQVWDISEFAWCDRENEFYMVQDYMNGEEQWSE